MKKFAIGFSVVLNITILAFAAWMFLGNGSKGFVKKFINPAHERLVSQFQIVKVSPGDTVFLGDSITAGGLWDELFPTINVRDRGIGGDVTAGVLARLDQITNGKPANVFLLIGTNDIAFGVSEAEIVSNVKEIIDSIHAQSPSTKLYLQSVLPRDIKYQAQVESLNRALEASVNARNKTVGNQLTWINLYPLFLDAEGTSINDSLSNDELHLNGQGYLVWKAAIEQYL